MTIEKSDPLPFQTVPSQSLEVVSSETNPPWRDYIDPSGLRDLAIAHDPDARTLTCSFTHARNANVTEPLVDEFLTIFSGLRKSKAIARPEGEEFWFRYYLFKSMKQSIFSFGGDLEMFVDCINTGDREKLAAYATACILACHDTYQNFELPIITVCLVSGDALGGGLECALACDFLVAEEGSMMGLPEVLFGMFPGMGAYSFLRRKIGQQKTEDMIFGGALYKAEELFEWGIVDVLAKKGQGEEELQAFLKRMDKKYNTYRSVVEARKRSFALDQSEMMDIVGHWVDSAFKVSRSDIRKMQRLSQMQKKRVAEESNGLLAAEGS